ncbi:MAG: aryl-sulfate sulfotransferase [Deltaproteobacteria bacterium]|nr:aryl-sulfate sulfotransferase [Deltaproteobacteria bacterium]
MKSRTLMLGETILLLGVATWLAYSGMNISPNYKHTNSQVEAISEKANLNLTVLNLEKAFPSYTLYPVTGDEEVQLLNFYGNVVHTWKVDATRARLLPNGNLLVVHGSKWGLNHEPWKSLRATVREYDWNGKIVWEYTASDIIHHDVQRLENGNTIFPVREIVPEEAKSKIKDSNRREMEIRSDKIVEVSPTGKVVWEWSAHEHLDLNECGKPGCRNESGAANALDRLSDWTHINTTTIIPENKWYDAGDARFKPGNIITLPRNWWTTFIVDKESKKVVWEYLGDYKGGVSGGHDPYMVEKGLPGEGNILLFDNGRIIHKGESYILEINPSTKELVWVYDMGTDFFSRSAGSVQRLPNGNTFISEDVAGRMLEVTPDKEVVWEFRGQDKTSRAFKYPIGYAPQLR